MFSRRFLIISAALFALGTAPLTQADEDAATRAAMNEVFGVLSELLPDTFDGERFYERAMRNDVDAQLAILERAAGDVERHAGTRDIGFRGLADLFSRSVADIRTSYDQGWPEETRYLLIELTQACSSCHARLPADADFQLADRLLDRIDAGVQYPSDRARLQIAIRDFDGALATWETQFADPQALPIEFDVDGDLLDYLAVALRVERDLPRASHTLMTLRSRTDTPSYLAWHIDGWIEALDSLQDQATGEARLDVARTLFQEATRMSIFPAGRERVVHDLVASSLLYRYLDANETASAEQRAEAYYMLGAIEARSVNTPWAVPQVEIHLESAIRSDPHGPYARQAYALLEEYVLLSVGSHRVYQSEHVLSALEELRELMR